jgi:hypothetical protein
METLAALDWSSLALGAGIGAVLLFLVVTRGRG